MWNGIRIQERGYMRTDGSVHPIPELSKAKNEYFKEGFGKACEEFKVFIETFEYYTLDGKEDALEGYDTMRYIKNTLNSAKEAIANARETQNGDWEKRIEFYKIWLDLLEKRLRKIKREIKTGKRK